MPLSKVKTASIAASTAFTTPALGTPTSGTLTNCTGLPNAGLVNSSVTIGGTAIALGASSSAITSDITISGLTVGKGGSALATNTAVGASALAASNSGTGHNVANGYQALTANLTGLDNTGVGYQALLTTQNDYQNTAVGSSALKTLNGASNNTAVGYNALLSTTTGGSNVAMGVQALQANTTGSQNTAIGYQAGYSNVSSNYNCYVGDGAGTSTTGARNTFIGQGAGNAVTSGANNTIIGGYNGNNGGLDIRTASNYIVLADGNGTPRLWFTDSGALLSPTVYSITTGSAANVFVGSNGHLHRSTSSLKYKRDVQEATHGLAEVLQLRPVTYKGKGENDGETVFGGLIAEEVHAAGLTEFVQYAEDGSPDALAYGNMVSLLVKSIQELKTIVDAQAAEIAELKAK